ncbi:MAG: mechanosensitive ion channel family protein [Polyangiaceae bacterium]|nr:mechanosensitive ion channel family protein [Polyangiaceae bacterium]
MFGLAAMGLIALESGTPPWWLLRRLPPWAITTTYNGIALWQWAALPSFFAFSMLVGWLVAKLFGFALVPVAKRSETRWDDDLLMVLQGPVRLLFGTIVFWHIVPLIALGKTPTKFLSSCIDVLVVISVLWGIFCALDITAKRVSERLANAHELKDRGGVLSVIAIGTKMAKVLVVLFGFVMALGMLGVEVTGIIAGLGIGGVAVAFAGQKTLENLFGSLVIGLDQPLRIGDFVKVEDLTGTVEQIGLRSTRIRTLDRTVVTMPNGKLSDTRIENYAARDRLRLNAKFGLRYSTKPETVRVIIEKMREYLRERPDVFPDTILVHLVGFGDSALVIEVNVWLLSQEWTEFLDWREETLLGLMEVIEANGSAIALPAQTLHVESMPRGVGPSGASPPNRSH